jgi:hypothetical protein
VWKTPVLIGGRKRSTIHWFMKAHLVVEETVVNAWLMIHWEDLPGSGLQIPRQYEAVCVIQPDGSDIRDSATVKVAKSPREEVGPWKRQRKLKVLNIPQEAVEGHSAGWASAWKRACTGGFRDCDISRFHDGTLIIDHGTLHQRLRCVTEEMLWKGRHLVIERNSTA